MADRSDILNKRTAPRRRSAAARRCDAGGRRAYVLIIVLGLAVISFSVGTAYLEAHATLIPEAENQMASSKAAYLAGSGVDIACHYLTYPPDSVADGDYWTGGAGIQVDGSGDYVNVRVTKDTTRTDVYQIDSFGITRDTSGSERGKRGVRAFVKLRPKAMIEIPYAIQGGGTLSAGTGVFVLGDMHSDKTLSFRGWCESHVSSSSSIFWMTFSVPASMNENVPTVETPQPDVTVYGTYMLNGTQYKAYELGTSTLTAANVGWLNAELDGDTDNPGRIVILPQGDVVINTGVDFYGTLIVDGNLHIKGNGANRFTAVAEYPALICCKDIRLGNDNATLLVNGAVVCKTLDLDRTDDSIVSISGALVTTDNDGIVDETGSNTYVTLQWNSHYAQYHDFRFTAEPYTLLSWTDY